MKFILFHPFDIGKWFVLGFTAWLATLFEGLGSGGGSGSSGDFSNDDTGNGDSGGATDDFNWENAQAMFLEWIETARTWIAENQEIAMLIGGILAFVIFVAFALYWVSCRGKFMFLDNVARNRAEVVRPWRQFRRQGNSLFWWTFFFGIFASVVWLGFFAGGLRYAFSALEAGSWNTENTLVLVGIGCGSVFFILVFAYIQLLLTDFVIPVMYQHELNTTQAWFRFLPLHNRRMFRFLLYAGWKILLSLVVLFGIVAVGFGTCCVGFILMAIPYLGAVFLLPVTVFFRALGPEFLAQFGEEWDVLDNPSAV